MITYSIIIPYRNRENHLQILLPRLQEVFQNKKYEIIIAEQNDNEKFQKNSLYNMAVKYSSGDLLIFHDVDYYPSDNVSYYTEINIPLYPVKQVVFLDENNKPKDINQIPAGYRFFHNNVGDHSGGVFVLSKELFYKVNGLNPYYKGWGKEDDDTRDRLRILGYEWKRNNGLFYSLPHDDNKPDDNDIDFINNHILLNNLKNNLHLGYKDVNANIEEYTAGDKIKWLKINNFKYNNY